MTTTCEFCKNEFRGRNYKDRGKSRFCTHQCYWNSMKTDWKKECVCATCGIKFVPKSNVAVLKYCSKRCHADNKEWRKRNSEWRKAIPSEYYSAMGIKSVASQGDGRESSIEKKVYDYLLLKGILFERQYVVNGKFVIDAYIPSLNLAIEADGSYWHSLPANMKRDKSKNAYLKAINMDLVRLTEEEIKNNKFIQKLERRLK